MSLFDTINSGGTQLLGVAWPTVWALVRILVVAVVILLCVAYLILWERKLIGWMHVRLGPNRVGPAGLLQPIADVLKLLLKEVIQPTQASRWIYLIAPIMVVVPAFAVWAVIPFQAGAVLGDINAGLLYAMAISSIGVYGVILAGWASNSKYAFLGAMRAAAQMVSYEISMGFALVVVLMTAGTLNLSDIVNVAGARLLRRTRPELPVVELAAAAADVRRVLHLGHRRDEPPSVRRGGRRVGNRRGPHDRLLGHGVRAVLPRRVHQHDRDLGVGVDAVPRRLDALRSASCRLSRASSGSSSRFSCCCRCSSGRVPRSRATAMTRSCVSAGRFSFRCAVVWLVVVGFWIMSPLEHLEIKGG